MLLIEEGRKELGDHNRIGKGARFFDDSPKTQRIDEYNKWKNKHSLKKKRYLSSINNKYNYGQK